MKKAFLAAVLMAIMQLGYAQYNERPTKSRFYNSKHSTFQIKPGDILVYSMREDKGEEKELLVTIKQIGDDISYSYGLNGREQATMLDKNTVLSNTNYVFNAASGSPTSLWLSRKNWRDLASRNKLTLMNTGSGQEPFTRSDASTLKIRYKGKDKILTVYNISGDTPTGKKQFSVLTDERNPLIVSMNMGHSMMLKEVR